MFAQQYCLCFTHLSSLHHAFHEVCCSKNVAGQTCRSQLLVYQLVVRCLKSLKKCCRGWSCAFSATCCIGMHWFPKPSSWGSKGLRYQWGFWLGTIITMGGFCFAFPNTKLRDYICDPVVIAFLILYSDFTFGTHSSKRNPLSMCVQSDSVLAWPMNGFAQNCVLFTTCNCWLYKHWIATWVGFWNSLAN